MMITNQYRFLGAPCYFIVFLMALSNFIVLKTLINHPKTEQIFVIVELISNVYIDQVWVRVLYLFFTLRLLNTTEAEAGMTPKTVF